MQITKIVFIISEIPYFPHTPQLLTDLQQFHLNKTRFFNQLGFFLLYFVYAAIDILSTQLGNPFLRKSGSNSISSQHGQGLSPAGGGSGARPHHLKSVPPHLTFGPRLLHTSNTVFKKCGPSIWFLPPPAAKSWRRA